MSLLVVVIAMALLTVPALTARSRLEPEIQVRIACLSASGGICLLVAGTLLTASPLLVWWHDAGAASDADLSHLSPGGPWAWTASAVVCGVGAIFIVSVFRHSAAARRRASLPRWASITVAHNDFARAEVRVAPTLEPIAFAVPGRDQHVVVSQSVSRLAEPELRAVLAHEGAHLRLRHDRYLLILTIYDRIWGWVPGAANVVAVHRHSIEQWADADAARLPQVDKEAIFRARAQLTSFNGIARAAPKAATDEPTQRSSLRDLIGITSFVATLIAAGAYSATHTVGDLSAVVAALH